MKLNWNHRSPILLCFIIFLVVHFNWAEHNLGMWCMDWMWMASITNKQKKMGKKHNTKIKSEQENKEKKGHEEKRKYNWLRIFLIESIRSIPCWTLALLSNCYCKGLKLKGEYWHVVYAMFSNSTVVFVFSQLWVISLKLWW